MIPLSNSPVKSNQKPADAHNVDRSVGIPPGKFVQFAYKDMAKVEILSFKRIENPETQMRNVVNLQIRFRLLKDNCDTFNNIYLSNTVARNPDTSETYEAVSSESTGIIHLCRLELGSSADAYVWMAIPEGVKAVDIFISNTGAFKNVPITN